MKKGTFFNIQRFSVHDGPGIRTILFTKGCPLRCRWCSNPESQNFFRELSFRKSNCIGWQQCGLCINTCPKQALSSQHQEEITIDHMLCDNCGQCVVSCPANALSMIGQDYTIAELLTKIEDDANFWWRSEGGPTIGGGEPFAQPEFVGELAKALKGRGYHVAIDTCGYFDIQSPGVQKALANVHLLLYDIKSMNAEKHRGFTGQSNSLILSNLRLISKRYPEIAIIARTPVIPGFNDTYDDIKAIASFLAEIDTVEKYELLPYHAFGTPKYTQLGRSYELQPVQLIDASYMESLQKTANEILARQRPKPANMNGE